MAEPAYPPGYFICLDPDGGLPHTFRCHTVWLGGTCFSTIDGKPINTNPKGAALMNSTEQYHLGTSKPLFDLDEIAAALRKAGLNHLGVRHVIDALDPRTAPAAAPEGDTEETVEDAGRRIARELNEARARMSVLEGETRIFLGAILGGEMPLPWWVTATHALDELQRLVGEES